MARGWRKLSPKLTKNQPPSPTFLFSVVSLFFPLLSRTFNHQHSYHHLSHYNLLHNQTPNHLTWWLHHLSLSLSSLQNSSSSMPPRPQQQQHQQKLPRPKAFVLPNSSWGDDFLLNHSNRELPLSFGSLCFFLFQLQPTPAADLTTSSHIMRNQSGRQLLPHQVNLPPLFFFFFLPSLLPLHANSRTWIIIHVTLFIHFVMNSATWIIIQVALFMHLSHWAVPISAQPSWLGRVQPKNK